MCRLAALALLTVALPVPAAEPPKRPNVVWIVVDDMSGNFSCYGETLIRTPHVDKLAADGTRFCRAFVTASVCSPCRSALVTGCYQTTIGAHHHRSGRGELKIHLPGDVVPVPVLLTSRVGPVAESMTVEAAVPVARSDFPSPSATCSV